jgi:Arc/MetJ family transcription regulator
MRALLEIDEEVLAAAEREASRRGQSLSTFVELALSAFVAPVSRTDSSRHERKRVELPTFRGQGLRPGVNLDDSAALLELMESPHAPD